MSPSDPTLLPFSVSTQGWDEATRLTVFDGHNRICARGVARIDTHLPKGLYQVRLERLGAMQDHLVIHDSATDAEFPPPLRLSAMPATDTRNTHEFYAGPGVHFSLTSTATDPDDKTGRVRLMIMLRASGNHDFSGVPLASGLTLFSADGMRITGFGPKDTEFDEAAGWLIYSALLNPGNHLLVRPAGDRAEFLPIRLHDGWDSMVFIPHEGSLRLSRSSLDMVRHDAGFNPSDDLAQKLDGAMQGLGENLDLLPDGLRNEAIYGKFSHPLHGLIGAYAHFLSGRRQERLEQQVLHNLWHLLPGSPDVIALLVLALEREQSGIPDSRAALEQIAHDVFGADLSTQFPMTFPPMLKPALRALVRASVRVPDLIQPGSWLEAAALSTFEGGGAWSVWDQDIDSVELALEVPDEGPPLPSSQKVYAAIKRAISDKSGVGLEQVRAASRLRDVLRDPEREFGQIMRNVASDLGGLEAAQVSPGRDDSVRDVMRSVQNNLRSTHSRTLSVAPQTDLPDWLLDFAREAAVTRTAPADAQALSLQVGVPLRQMQQALARIDGRN